MQKIVGYLMVGLLLAASPLLAAGTKATGMHKGQATFVEAQNLRWVPAPDNASMQTAVVDSDPAHNTSHMYIKFAPGFAAPVHHHTADHFVTVVSGTLLITTGGKEHRLTPGSYFAFRGKEMHATKCESGAECLLFLDVRGKWDVVMSDDHAKSRK